MIDGSAKSLVIILLDKIFALKSKDFVRLTSKLLVRKGTTIEWGTPLF
jgi:hypothetical protein